MEHAKTTSSPCRVSDLIASRENGASVNCRVSFDILPVDFTHRDHPFQAFIFLCRFSGDIDGREYAFRKCYARGCPNNLCPHVSQAVMIANRYLQRDYRRLEEHGVEIDRRLFTVEDMMVKFDEVHGAYGNVMAIDDYIALAHEGNDVVIGVALEFVPAVEHFANELNPQMFLMVDFEVTSLGNTCHIERCLACYPREEEEEERFNKVGIANRRLEVVYEKFDQASIQYNERFFE